MKSRSFYASLLLCAYPSVGGIMFGYDSGYINGLLGMDWFKYQFGHAVPITMQAAYLGYMYSSGQQSLIISILSAGTFIGALLSGFFADRFGRRRIIQFACLIYSIGVAFELASSSIPLFAAGRAIAGIGIGIESSAVIIYLSEISPKEQRGAIVSTYQCQITIGVLFAALIDWATHGLHNAGAYHIPIGLQFIWAAGLGIGIEFLLESPRWLVMRGRREDARNAIATFRGLPLDSAVVGKEYNELLNTWLEEKDNQAGWKDCFTGGLKRVSNLHRTLIGMTIQMFQQFTGINFIIYFGTTFFQHLGIQSPFVISIITAVVLLFGSAGMSFCLLTIATVGTTMPENSVVAHIILIVFVCSFIAIYSFTWGPGAWAVTSEVFSLPLRAKGIALATASNWLWNLIIASITPYLVDEDKANLGTKVFFIWGGVSVIGMLFVYFCVPELRGRSLEEAEKLMKEVSARKSKNWKAVAKAKDEETEAEFKKEDWEHLELQKVKSSIDSREQQLAAVDNLRPVRTH